MRQLDLPADSSRTTQLAIGAFVLACGVALLSAIPIGSFPFEGDLRQGVIAGSTAVVLVGISCLFLVSRRQNVLTSFRHFEVGPWWIARYMVQFGFTSFVWINRQTGLGATVDQYSVTMALLLVMVSLLLWASGYVVGPPGSLRRGMRRVVDWAIPPDRWAFRYRSLPLLVYAVGVVGRFIQIRSGRFGYLGDPARALFAPTSVDQVISQLAKFGHYGLILATLAFVLRPSTRTRFTFVLLLCVELSFALASGVKEQFLLTFLAVAIVYAILRGRISRRLIALAMVGLLMLIPLNVAYRLSLQGRTRADFNAVDAIRALPRVGVDNLVRESVGETLRFSLTSLVSRLRLVDSTAVIMDRTPHQINYLGWGSLGVAPFLGLAPRFLWPEKPVLSYGYQFGQDYLGIEASVYTSPAVTLPGDLFRYQGWLAVVVGMFFLGMVARLIFDVLHPSRDFRLLLIYIPMFVSVADIEIDVASFMADLVQTFLVLLLFMRFVFVSAAAHDGQKTNGYAASR